MTERFEPVLDFARRRRFYIFGLGLLVAIGAGVALTRVPFEADILKLIPQGGPAVQAFRTYVDRLDSLDYLYVLFESPSGHAISEYEELIETYIEELRAAPEIDYVDAALFDSDKDWDYLLDRILLLLGEEGAQEALEKFQPRGMELALARSRDGLTIPSPEMRSLVQRDPLGFLLLLRSRFADNKAFSQFDPAAQGYVSLDGGSRLVIAKPVRPAFDTTFSERLMVKLTEIERHTRRQVEVRGQDTQEPLPPVLIQIAGAYRDAKEAENLIRSEMKTNAFVSLVLILTIVFFVFRSYWILLCAATTLGLAGLLAMALVGVAKGDLLAASTGGAAMLFGLGIDGIVLLYVRYLEERGRGMELAAATKRLSHTVASVMLGNITTVATFAALMFIDFPSLEELGCLVGLGMLLCAALTIFFVPAFLSYQQPIRPGWSPQLPRLSEFVARRSTAILWCAGGLTVVSLLLLPRLVVVASLEKIQPRTPGAAVEQKLKERFQFQENVILALAEGPQLDTILEQQRKLEEALATRSEGVSVSSPLAFLPPSREQAAVGELMRAAGVTSSNVAQRLEEATAAAGFRPGVFEPFIDRLPTLLDPAERITYEGLMEHGLGPVTSRFIAKGEEGYLAVTYLYPHADSDVMALARAVKNFDPSLGITGQALVNAELKESFLPQFLKAIVIGTIAGALLIYLDFHSVRLTLLCLLPTALGLLWSAGVFALVGYELDLFSVFGVVMVIGIGVDYAIHILHRAAIEAGRDLQEFLPWTGAAIALAALTTIIGFGTLAFSSYRPLATLGVVVAISVVFIALASLLVLPAILGGRAR